MSSMNEQDTLIETPASEATAKRSAGQWLRQARERAGVDLGVLSALIKVPVRQLQALEADQHDQLMGTAFVRSLTVTICRHLNIDPQPALDVLPDNTTRLGPEKDSLGEADVPQLGGLFHGRSVRWGKWLALGLLVFLAVGAYVLWRQSPVVAPVPELVPQAVMPVPVPAEPPAASAADAAPGSSAQPVVLPVTVLVPSAPASVSTENKGQ